jgi:hypothetical protein
MAYVPPPDAKEVPPAGISLILSKISSLSCTSRVMPKAKPSRLPPQVPHQIPEAIRKDQATTQQAIARLSSQRKSVINAWISSILRRRIRIKRDQATYRNRLCCTICRSELSKARSTQSQAIADLSLCYTVGYIRKIMAHETNRFRISGWTYLGQRCSKLGSTY